MKQSYLFRVGGGLRHNLSRASHCTSEDTGPRLSKQGFLSPPKIKGSLCSAWKTGSDHSDNWQVTRHPVGIHCLSLKPSKHHSVSELWTCCFLLQRMLSPRSLHGYLLLIIHALAPMSLPRWGHTGLRLTKQLSVGRCHQMVKAHKRHRYSETVWTPSTNKGP